MDRAFSVYSMPTSHVRVDRILCAVTFSPSSRRVVAWAASVAGPYSGEVRLFHVVAASDERAEADLEDDSGRLLKKLSTVGEALPGRPRISAAVTEGDAEAEILRHARMVRADVIAVGMRGRDGSLSPLVARLAISAPCPVLAVDETSVRSPPSGPPEQVVAAVNFLPASLAAADYACAFAHAANAQVTVVHVLPERWEGPRRQDANVDESRRLVERHFRHLLHSMISDIPGARGNRSEVVVSGQPCVELVRIVTARNADLIVMGIDGGHKSKREEFGETARCVMQCARKTVLLVPARLFQGPETGPTDRSSRSC